MMPDLKKATEIVRFYRENGPYDDSTPLVDALLVIQLHLAQRVLLLEAQVEALQHRKAAA